MDASRRVRILRVASACLHLTKDIWSILQADMQWRPQTWQPRHPGLPGYGFCRLLYVEIKQLTSIRGEYLFM